MAIDAFKNLDSLILDQPDMIDLDITKIGETDTDSDKEPKDKKDPEDKNKKLDKGVIEDGLLEVDEIEKVDDVTDLNKDKSKETSQEDTINAWADEFKDKSLLTDEDLEGFDKTLPGLVKAFEAREVRVGLEMVDDYKKQLPDMLKYLADNWEEGVPLDELLNIKSNQIRYANVTEDKLEESVETQKAVMSEYLRKTTKYSETKIEKEVTRLIDLDELKSESKEVLSELKKFEVEAEETIKKETKKARELRQAENAETIKKYTKLSKEVKEVIPGLKLDNKIQEDVLNKVINPIGVDGNGNPVSYIQSIRNEDPLTFDLKLNYLATITKGFTDFSKITNAVVTKTTNDLSKIINQSSPKGSNSIDASGKKGILDYLSLPQNRKK